MSGAQHIRSSDAPTTDRRTTAAQDLLIGLYGFLAGATILALACGVIWVLAR